MTHTQILMLVFAATIAITTGYLLWKLQEHDERLRSVEEDVAIDHRLPYADPYLARLLGPDADPGRSYLLADATPPASTESFDMARVGDRVALDYGDEIVEVGTVVAAWTRPDEGVPDTAVVPW